MPTQNNYVLGRGRVHFSRFLPNTQTPEGFRYIGNTPEFNLNIESEDLDHYNSDEGIREKDDSVVLEVNRTGSLITDNIDPQNVALFFFGTHQTLTQALVASQTITMANPQPGRSYKIGASAQNPTGFFGINATGFEVETTVGSTALVAGTDYEVNLDAGLITFLEGSTLVTGAADIDITFAVRESTRERVISGNAAVEGAMMYETRNPKGAQSMFYMPWIKVMPNGDYALKGDEWQQIPLQFEILKPDATQAIYQDGLPVYQ